MCYETEIKMRVCIAEKPSVAKEIADIVGWILRREWLSGNLDFWTFMYTERTTRIYSAMEIMVFMDIADDSSAFWYKTYTR